MEQGSESLDRLQQVASRIRRRSVLALAVLTVIAAVSFLGCIFVGSVGLTLGDVFRALLGDDSDWSNYYIVTQIRVPRLLCAAMVGAALSLAGMCMQALFKNPMASPSVLGISSGASFGAAFYIAIGVGIWNIPWGTTACAFVMSAVTMILVYSLARGKGGVRTIMLLMSGMAISALFSGLTSGIEFFSDEDTVSSIVFWTMGSLAECTWGSVKLMVLPIVTGCFLILICSRELNLISSGEKKARALGVNVKRVRILLLIGDCLLVAGAVSSCGVIGFVGLIIPHIFRAVCGPDHMYLAPACILGGASFLMLVDTVARTIVSPFELPIGIITSILGAPFFIYIMKRKEKTLWEV